MCDIFPHLRACFVHRSLGSDKGHYAAAADFIQCFRKEIIVDQEFLGVVTAVIDLKIAKRHIADNDIKMVIGKFCLLKSLNGNAGFLVKLLCNSSCKRVDFYTVKR